MTTATQVSFEEMEEIQIQLAEEAAAKWAMVADVRLSLCTEPTHGLYQHVLEIFAPAVPAGITADQLLEALKYESESITDFLHHEWHGEDWLLEQCEYAINAEADRVYMLIEYESEKRTY